jgi:hypothetical protein
MIEHSYDKVDKSILAGSSDSKQSAATLITFSNSVDIVGKEIFHNNREMKRAVSYTHASVNCSYYPTLLVLWYRATKNRPER